MSENSSPKLESTSAAAASTKKPFPEWIKPKGKETELLINNSLTGGKVPFVFNESGKGRSLTWYACGPTVYDASHMGHARTYISFDIIRRIMKNYLGFNIQYVMNITDIDDKIIIRANENGISHSDLSKKWETAFFEDMKLLNVLPPDALTRVTEYVPQIVEYVEKIISNGFAYESNGSVYFDTVAFSKAHDYGKLEPNSVGNEKLAAEGEGSLTATSAVSEKRSGFDFALWKKSKPGEPVWNSPWGEGRPGWHIECSAMASDLLGGNIDIHSGGSDLKFPHHDNELAQSEAFYGNRQWINYFVHSGHLLIDGLKMSKSLKNFITIKQALEKYTSRQMRMFFILHKYDKAMNYSPESMGYAIEMEKTFVEFFHTAKQILRDSPLSLPQFWTQAEKDLNKHLQNANDQVHQFILDNFNTSDALKTLSDLVNKTNVYIRSCAEQKTNPRLNLISAIAEYITYIFSVFGLTESSTASSMIGFGSAGKGNIEEEMTPILNALTQFRSEVRASAIAKDTTSILKTCDNLRDEVLPLLGVKIDDKSATTAMWKFEDKETLKKEIEQKKEIEKKKQADKEEKEKKLKEKFEKSKIPPQQLFINETDKYSKFNELGMPTHDKEGVEITKSQLKKLQKEYDNQTKEHNNYLKSLPSTSTSSPTLTSTQSPQ
ncbi:hypothetical protein ACTFIR_011789 [Dictyostelium discoideum]